MKKKTRLQLHSAEGARFLRRHDALKDGGGRGRGCRRGRGRRTRCSGRGLCRLRNVGDRVGGARAGALPAPPDGGFQRVEVERRGAAEELRERRGQQRPVEVLAVRRAVHVWLLLPRLRRFLQPLLVRSEGEDHATGEAPPPDESKRGGRRQLVARVVAAKAKQGAVKGRVHNTMRNPQHNAYLRKSAAYAQSSIPSPCVQSLTHSLSSSHPHPAAGSAVSMSTQFS